MDENFEIEREKNFQSLWWLYFMIFFFTGILPVNIGNLLLNLPGTTPFGLGVLVASTMATGMISMITFGYFEDKISEKYSRKKIFLISNLIWVIADGLICFSTNYFSLLIFAIIGAVGAGAFLPIGYSIIGDSYSPKERGTKYGLMQIGLTLGTGTGIIMGGLLGAYAGPNGWRFAYGLGGILSLLALYTYYKSGINPKRGQAEPEFNNLNGEINYNYKLTFKNLVQLFKKKSIASIFIYMICFGISSTLGFWAIFYISTKFDGPNAGLYATTILILSGIGALPGAFLGGKIGDSMYKAGKVKGRVILSMGGLIIGIFCFFGFYLIPFNTATSLQTIVSWIFFIAIGFLGFFFTSLSAGNIFAIYSEVCVPELRSTANALNGIMLSIGGIIGNLLLSSFIERDMSLFSMAISLILLIWLISTLLWIIPYFYYPREANECRDLLAKRRIELEKS